MVDPLRSGPARRVSGRWIDDDLLGAGASGIGGVPGLQDALDGKEPLHVPGTLSANILAKMLTGGVHTYQGEPTTIASRIRHEFTTHIPGGIPTGFDGRNQKLTSAITNGDDVFLFETKHPDNPGYIDVRNLRFKDLAIYGNGAEGAGLRLRAWYDGTGSAIYKARLEGLDMYGLGGDGVAFEGYPFENDVVNYHAEACAGWGIQFKNDPDANPAQFQGQTTCDGGNIRTCTLGGIRLETQTRDVLILNYRFISNLGPGVLAENGCNAIENCFFENCGLTQNTAVPGTGAGIIISNYGYIRRCIFSSSTLCQPVAVYVPNLTGRLVLDSCTPEFGTPTLCHVAAASGNAQLIIMGMWADRTDITAVTGVLTPEQIIRIPAPPP
jgi:hypothetical protein